MFSGASSIIGKQIDFAFYYILVICLIMLVLITSLMVIFVIKYRRSRNPTPVNIHGNTLLEIFWTVIPTLLVLSMFYVGWTGYQEMMEIPEGSLPVKVTARMWSWVFEYENGRQSDVLNLPVGKPVKLELFSQDVLHSFFVPAFRVKKDMVPGIKNLLWFTPDEVGSYDLFCAEYCGVGHSAMLGKVVVMPETEFSEWLQGKEAARDQVSDEPWGMALLKLKGCRGCHSLDGSRLVGPTLQGLWGKQRKVMTGDREREVVVDEEYLRRSLLEPNADVVTGYPAVMPSQKGKLTEEEISEIIETLKNL